MPTQPRTAADWLEFGCLSTSEAARRCRVSRRTVERWAAGQPLTAAGELQLITAATGMHPDYWNGRWHGWRLSEAGLIDPTGNANNAGQIQLVSLYRQQIRVLKRQLEEPQQFKLI